jgi:hypothetical protein
MNKKTILGISFFSLVILALLLFLSQSKKQAITIVILSPPIKIIKDENSVSATRKAPFTNSAIGFFPRAT